MRIVLDTNVLVSGLLSPFGPPGMILRLVACGSLQLQFDGRILAEYRAVLERPKFGFDPADVATLIDQIKAEGATIAAPPLASMLPDRDDEAFLEVALASRAQALVTGNRKHFPLERYQGMPVVSPAKLMEMLREAQRSTD